MAKYSSDKMIYIIEIIKKLKKKFKKIKEVQICKFLFIGKSDDRDARIKKKVWLLKQWLACLLRETQKGKNE